MRWILPLLLVVPLAAPTPSDEIVAGRAATLDDAPRTPAPRSFPTQLRPFDDGISPATSRVLPSEEPSPQPPLPPAREWSYGPAHYSPPDASLDQSSVDPPAEAPGAPASPTPAPDAAPATPDASPPAPTPSPAPAPPSQDAPPSDDEPPAAEDPHEPPEDDAPQPCAGLCFSLELGLL